MNIGGSISQSASEKTVCGFTGPVISGVTHIDIQHIHPLVSPVGVCYKGVAGLFDQICYGGIRIFAAGVFSYFKKEEVRKLFSAMAERFPGAVLAFDTCNERGAKLMRKTWLKEAGITDVGAYFSLEYTSALGGWSDHFASVTAKSYMRGYYRYASLTLILYGIL